MRAGTAPSCSIAPGSRSSRRRKRCFFSIAATNIPVAGRNSCELLGLDDVAIFAWDARGHGRSAGERGAAENFRDDGEGRGRVRAARFASNHGIRTRKHDRARAQRRRGHGRGLGARLRAADSRDDSGDAGVSREALRAVRHPIAAAETEIRRARLREELRESEDAHARSGAGRALRRRSADLSPDRGQRPPRFARHPQRLLADAGAINVPTLMLSARVATGS